MKEEVINYYTRDGRSKSIAEEWYLADCTLLSTFVKRNNWGQADLESDHATIVGEIIEKSGSASTSTLRDEFHWRWKQYNANKERVEASKDSKKNRLKSITNLASVIKATAWKKETLYGCRQLEMF